MGLDTLADSVAEHIRDSLRTQRHAHRDSVKAGLLKAPLGQCDTSEFRVVQRTEGRHEGWPLKVAYRTPCDVKRLANSPDLPGSIFDPGDEIFGATERDALIKEALSLGAQPPFLLGSGHLPPPTIRWGADLMRYNRVEGFSAGAQVDQPLGGGYTARAVGRLGLADFEPNVELTLERTNLEKTYALTGYNRLVAANDWGNPLSFGSSLSALLFGNVEVRSKHRDAHQRLHSPEARGKREQTHGFADAARVLPGVDRRTAFLGFGPADGAAETCAVPDGLFTRLGERAAAGAVHRG